MTWGFISKIKNFFSEAEKFEDIQKNFAYMILGFQASEFQLNPKLETEYFLKYPEVYQFLTEQTINDKVGFEDILSTYKIRKSVWDYMLMFWYIIEICEVEGNDVTFMNLVEEVKLTPLQRSIYESLKASDFLSYSHDSDKQIEILVSLGTDFQYLSDIYEKLENEEDTQEDTQEDTLQKTT